MFFKKRLYEIGYYMVNIYSCTIEARSPRQAIRKFHKKAGTACDIVYIRELKEGISHENN